MKDEKFKPVDETKKVLPSPLALHYHNAMPTEPEILKLLSVGEANSEETDLRFSGLCDLAIEMGDPAPLRDTPAREVMTRLGDNWSALIIKILATGSFRHATLKRVVAAFASEKDISQRMLTLRLRALERDGFILRKVRKDTNPSRVDYALTPLGLELENEFSKLLKWIEHATLKIEMSRAKFQQQDGKINRRV